MYETYGPTTTKGTAMGGSIPAYGGDCALQQESGLGTAIQRNLEVTVVLMENISQLEAYFGLSAPSNKEPHGPGSPRDSVRLAGDRVADAINTLQRVLSHLQS